MSTGSSTRVDQLLERLNKIMAYKSEDEEIEAKAQHLMFGYISEITIFMEKNKINQKTLAERIKTSSSYLTQVFSGDKPLNFVTIAKIEKALGIKFTVKARPRVNLDNAMPVVNMPTSTSSSARKAKKKSSK